MFKNVASQVVSLFAFDTTTGAPKTGDSANMVFYVSKDDGAVTAIAASSGVPTEIDATNAKGWYKIALSQAETNADKLLFSGKSTTANVSIVGGVLYTTPNRFSTLVIDAAGLVDANAVKVGPTGSGTAQTARDVGASVIAASVSTGGIVAGSFAAGAIDAAAIATDAIGSAEVSAAAVTKIQAGLSTYSGGAVSSVTGNVGGNVVGSVGSVTGAAGSVTGAVGSVTGSVGGNVTGSVGSVAGAVGSVIGNVGGNVVGTVASVVGNVGGNVTGSVGSVVAAVAVTSNIKKNQALLGFTFVMIDSSDHVTGKTGLTVTATRSIGGAAFASCANAVSEISAGAYKIDLASADLNGDTILLKFSATGADTRFIEIETQP